MRAIQGKLGSEKAGAMVEGTIAAIARGLVQRGTSDTNRRIVLLSLTPAGRAFYEANAGLLLGFAASVRGARRVAEGKAQRVEVRTGTRRDAMVEVVEGVQAGEVVVTAGQLKLRDGAAVKLATGGVARAD